MAKQGDPDILKDDRRFLQYLSFQAIFPPVIAMAPVNAELGVTTATWRILIVIYGFLVVSAALVMRWRQSSRVETIWVTGVVAFGVVASVVARIVGDVVTQTSEWVPVVWMSGVMIGGVYLHLLWQFDDKVLYSPETEPQEVE